MCHIRVYVKLANPNTCTYTQAAAAALEEISANSTALLEAGGHVWGSGIGGTGSSGRGAIGGDSSNSAVRNGCLRPASSSGAEAMSPCMRQTFQYGNAAAKRSYSFNSSSTDSAGSGAGGGVGGGFKLVFPAGSDSDRTRYCRILQVRAKSNVLSTRVVNRQHLCTAICFSYLRHDCLFVLRTAASSSKSHCLPRPRHGVHTWEGNDPHMRLPSCVC